MNEFQRFLDENLGKVNLQNDDMNESVFEEYDIYAEIRQEIIALYFSYGTLTEEVQSASSADGN